MPEWLIEVVEVTFGCGMFLNGALFMPQVIKIYKTKSAEGLSLTTFAGFNLIQLLAMLHGYIHNDWVLIFGFAVSFLCSGAVTLGIFKYR
ncbi:MAG: hypothetical protein LBF54_04420 [Holosporaceae bacterium]|jgi:MtN3 and saliva related transmembrane protein|nr:hypothetical protein [Holosporaceae bacterium]